MAPWEPTSPAVAAAAVRRAGVARVAGKYLAITLAAAFAADATLGPGGLAWYHGPGGAAGVGVAFAAVWAYCVSLRLGRRLAWRRAILGGFIPAAGLITIAVVLLRLFTR